MPEVLLLVGDPARARNDNHLRLPAAFARAGWRVTRADHDTVEIRTGRLTLDGRDADAFALVWLLGFGQQGTFFDRMQLLRRLPAERFVNTPDALTWLHGKHHWLHLMPETHTSTHPERLFAVVSSGGDWIVKPTAGSYGRDVTLFRAGEASMEDLTRLSRAVSGGYLMVQRYLPEIQAGEKRTLVAGGRLIGSYLRVPTVEVRANLAAEGRAEPTCLTPSETDLVTSVARDLEALGVTFAAVDTVGRYLMEVNVANPGGLATMEALYGKDLTGEVVQTVLQARGQPTAP
ncbi:MAG: hypothetical protein PVF57_09125 [Pseudomonadales bacterium]|jgi:glutathione synthetase